MKRLFDLSVSGCALFLLALPFVALALWIKLSSPGPVFFRQTRVGRGGKPFALLKFRSMVADAEQIGGYATQIGDPRVTATGRILRRMSLDELPQLINVLKGDMSLVGPRPDVPAQKELYTEDEWARRHAVRPGITGLAQVNGRSDVAPEVRKALDLEYVSVQSFQHDLCILRDTIMMLGGRGSN